MILKAVLGGLSHEIVMKARIRIFKFSVLALLLRGHIMNLPVLEEI